MKRLLSLTVVLCLLLSLTAFASDIDLSALSDDELLEVKLKVDAEMDVRKLDSDKYSDIQMGVYTVGVDIKAGTYIFTGYVKVDIENDISCGEVVQYDNMEDLKNHTNGTYDPVEPGKPVRITLEDGKVFEIKYQMLGVRQADPLPFAP